MSWKTIWSSLKNADMRKRIFAVLGMILVFRIFAHIPVPLADPKTLQQILENIFTSKDTPQLFSFINVLSGGALANFSIMLVGMGPYINASIIMQLLTKAIPSLENLNKDGEFGRKKINQYTRILTFPLAIIQSIGAIYLVRQSASSIAGLFLPGGGGWGGGGGGGLYYRQYFTHSVGADDCHFDRRGHDLDVARRAHNRAEYR